VAKFENLKYDITKMLSGDHALENLELKNDTAHSIVRLAKNIATHTLDMVNHKPSAPKNPSNTSIRMSELGEPCMRKLMYKWYHPAYASPPYAEAPEPFLPVKFTFGDYIEELTLFLASESGHKVLDRQKEVELRPVGTKWYAVGHMDAKIDDYVVDVKSAADGSFSKYKREGLTEANDSFGYLWQLDAYAYAEGTNNRAFLFTNKHDGNIHIIDRSVEPLLPIDDKIRGIGWFADEYLAKAELPERMPTKATKYGNQLGTVCSYCAFKYACYDGDVKAVISSGRPMYFVGPLTTEGETFAKDKSQIKKPEAYAKA
jgi:hypothetical protein